ncbi:MAG: Flp family type IVb pilin [Candidatus Kaiserbacteria bacterium]|nr:MAG: Flp family type IVb pilin [Candidatus Kaiserbacteria bacterium]
MKKTLWNAVGFAIGLKGDPVLARRFRNQTNATAIEYGLIAAGISVAIIAVVQGLGGKVASLFGN